MKKNWMLLFIFIIICLNCFGKSARGDGYIYPDKIIHNKDDLFFNSKESIKLKVLTAQNDIEKMEVIYIENGKKKKKNMDYLGNEVNSDVFGVEIPVEKGKVEYYFLIKDGRKKYFYGENGIKRESGIIKFSFNGENYKENNSVDWIKAGIAYEIVIDRFRNGDNKNDPLFNEITFSEINPCYSGNKGGVTLKSVFGDLKKNTSMEDFYVSEWGSNWGKTEKWEQRIKSSKQDSRRYGGDISGIKEKLPYLKELGVKTIILSPIFYGENSYKDMVKDFNHIDPSFGVIIQSGTKGEGSITGDSEYKFIDYDKNTMLNGAGENLKTINNKFTESDVIFSDFVKEVHKNGIRVIVKLPSDYTSSTFPAFKKALFDGPDSEYSKWYYFNDWNKNTEEEKNQLVEYFGSEKTGIEIVEGRKYRKRWIKEQPDMNEREKREIFDWNLKNTRYFSEGNSYGYPKLNFGNKEVYDYYKNAIIKWIKGYDRVVTEKTEEDDGIDGIIFLDYATAKNQNELYEIGNEIKEIKKDFFVGNDLGVAELKKIQMGKTNGILNYGVGINSYKFIINKQKEVLKPEQFKTEIEQLYFEIPSNIIENSFNTFGAADIDRIFSMVINSDREYDRDNNSMDENYKSIRPDIYKKDAVDNLKKMVVMQFFMPGIPLIYYGDEKGMWGADDAENRKPMLWDDIKYVMEGDVLSKYKKENILFEDGSAEVDEANNRVFYEVKSNEEIEKFYKKILKAREDNLSLFQNGKINFIVYKNDSNFFAVERKIDKKSMLFLLNFTDKENEVKIPLEYGGDYFNLDDNERYTVIDKLLTIKMKANQMMFLIKK